MDWIECTRITVLATERPLRKLVRLSTTAKNLSSWQCWHFRTVRVGADLALQTQQKFCYRTQVLISVQIQKASEFSNLLTPLLAQLWWAQNHFQVNKFTNSAKDSQLIGQWLFGWLFLSDSEIVPLKWKQPFLFGSFASNFLTSKLLVLPSGPTARPYSQALQYGAYSVLKRSWNSVLGVVRIKRSQNVSPVGNTTFKN